MRLVLIAAFAATISLAYAHDHDPANDAWYRSLTNQMGGACCDGSDAFSVLDPDWDTTTDPEFPYKVKIGGEWLKVNKNSVVKQTNKVGIAKVWPVAADDDGNPPYIRCFMPGSGA